MSVTGGEKVVRSLTLCVLKPQLTANSWATKIVRQILRQQGFRIEKGTKTKLDLIRAERLYYQHREKFFYNRLMSSICSGPVTAYILSRENAIKRWRDIMGPTKVYMAIHSHPNSIRGRFGLTDTRNATHGSDSPESVIEEIKIFFPQFSVEDWYNKQKINS